MRVGDEAYRFQLTRRIGDAIRNRGPKTEAREAATEEALAVVLATRLLAARGLPYSAERVEALADTLLAAGDRWCDEWSLANEG